MGYIAAVDFVDTKDGNRLYRAGEQFPRPGLAVSDKRLAELAGSGNRIGFPLIKADGEAPKAPKPKTTRKRVSKDA